MTRRRCDTKNAAHMRGVPFNSRTRPADATHIRTDRAPKVRMSAGPRLRLSREGAGAYPATVVSVPEAAFFICSGYP